MSKGIKVIDYPLNVGQSFYDANVIAQIKADLANKNANGNYLYSAMIISKSDNGILFISGENETEILKTHCLGVKDSEKFYTEAKSFDFDSAIDVLENNLDLAQYGLKDSDLEDILYDYFAEVSGIDITGYKDTIYVYNNTLMIFYCGDYSGFYTETFMLNKFPNFKFKRHYTEDYQNFIMIITPNNELLKFRFDTECY